MSLPAASPSPGSEGGDKGLVTRRVFVSQVSLPSCTRPGGVWPVAFPGALSPPPRPVLRWNEGEQAPPS